MLHFACSLNLSVCVGVGVFEALRQLDGPSRSGIDYDDCEGEAVAGEIACWGPDFSGVRGGC